MTHQISDEQKKRFASVFLLDKMVSTPLSYPVLLEGDDAHLEDLLTFMMSNGTVDIDDRQRYLPTKKGRDLASRFKSRYQDYLRNFDVFCAVDLEEGDFAFHSWWDYESDEEWEAFLDEEQFDDLRVTVALFKKLDPTEIVFMSFVNEGRFNDTVDGWQFDLLLGTTWDEIVEVVDSAIKPEDLEYEDDDGQLISSEAVMKDILLQGAELNLEIKQEEEALAKEESEQEADEQEVVEEVIEEIPDEVYYGYVHDPYYVSPVWLAILFL